MSKANPTEIDRVVSVKEAAQLVGKNPTTLWRWERRGEFVSRRKFGPNTVGYLQSELTSWLRSRPKVNGERT